MFHLCSLKLLDITMVFCVHLSLCGSLPAPLSVDHSLLSSPSQATGELQIPGRKGEESAIITSTNTYASQVATNYL